MEPYHLEEGSFAFVNATVVSGTKQQPPSDVQTVGLREGPAGNFLPDSLLHNIGFHPLSIDFDHPIIVWIE